jgi:hypothetical protein
MEDYSYRVVDNKNQWDIIYEKNNNYPISLMAIKKYNWSYHARPVIQSRNNKYYVIFMDSLDGDKSGLSWYNQEKVIKKINLSYLSSVVDNFALNVGMKIISFIKPQETTEIICM